VKTLANKDGLLVRGVESVDIPILARWMSDLRVMEYYVVHPRSVSEEEVRGQFLSKGRDQARDRSTGRFYEYRACIAEAEGRPVAFVQYHTLRYADSELFGYPSGRRTYVVDLFIGNPELWGKGLGTRIIDLTRDYLCKARRATRVVANPRADNSRSIRAFEKARFRKVRLLRVNEKIPWDSWLMEYP